MIDERIATLLQEVGIQTSEIEATIEQRDPILSTPFHVGEADATVRFAPATAILWQERTRQRQTQKLTADTRTLWMENANTHFGQLTSLTPIAQLSATPGRYARPVVPPGYDTPA